MGDILKGRIPNKLVPLKHKMDGRWVDLGLGTISPIRDDAGNVQLRIFTRLDEPQYKISPYKELFTDKEIERLTKEEEKLKKELAEANDKYLRLMAEYDNFRKRSAKERLELTDTAKGNVINGFLPVFDNFERALGTETQDAVYKQGVEMIFNQFSDALKKLNVEVMELAGKEFDPNVATAVSTVDDPDLGENIVAQVLQNGYTIGGKVIRHAMVIVANP